MKKIITFLSAVLLTATTWSQSPEKISYQAVIRDAENALVASQTVGMQISILQGSVEGTPVFVETQTPSTNINGLASLKIGTGIPVSGDFTTIDWGNDTYFIKTETDPTGGTAYTINGTSQLMSVPYALHAKTAENVVNTSGTNTGDQDISGIAINANLIADLEARISALEPTKIGDFKNGGVVIWINPTDTDHGLVVALNESRGPYGCPGVTINGADGSAIGDGAQNTIDIENECITPGTAADLCANATYEGFTDWFLPSKETLLEIYPNLSIINTTITANGGDIIRASWYWSSTENSPNAWLIVLSYGSAYSIEPKSYTAGVRAVRAF